MTEQCRAVMSECDFPEAAARTLERVLCQHSPAQVLALVWSKDPEGRREVDWFLPFFDRGYVKRVVFLDPEPDFSEAFWLAYECASGALELMSTFDLAHVQAMSSDLPRMRRAIDQSKVRKAAYVRKVWEGLAPTRQVEYTKVELKIGNGGVRTKDI